MKNIQITDSLDGYPVGTNDSLWQLNYHLLRINQAIDIHLQHQELIAKNTDWLAKVRIASGVLTKLQMQIEALRKDELDLLSKPGDTIKETMKELGIELPTLAINMDIMPSHLKMIIAGSAPITPAIAHKLARALNIDAQFWLNREANYRAKLAELQKNT